MCVRARAIRGRPGGGAGCARGWGRGDAPGCIVDASSSSTTLGGWGVRGRAEANGWGGGLGFAFPLFSPSLLPLSFLLPSSLLLSAVTSSFRGGVARGGGEVVVVVMTAGCGCADDKVASSAGRRRFLDTKLMVEKLVGVEGVDARPLVRDVELKRFRASSKVKIVSFGQQFDRDSYLCLITHLGSGIPDPAELDPS